MSEETQSACKRKVQSDRTEAGDEWWRSGTLPSIASRRSGLVIQNEDMIRGSVEGTASDPIRVRPDKPQQPLVVME